MSHSRHLPLTDLAATAALGDRLAGLLVAGDIVCLSGDLGAGKTTLARQAITGAGVDTIREARITGFGSWESRVDEF